MSYNDAMKRLARRLTFVPVLLLALGLTLLGLLAINRIVNTMWPFDVSRLELVRATAQQRVDAAVLLTAARNEIVVAFLASVVVAFTGLAMPLVYILNRRFSTTPDTPPSFLTVIRQSLWVGLWAAFCAYLQMNRTLGLAVAILVAGVLILFELLLQLRSRAATVEQQHTTT